MWHFNLLYSHLLSPSFTVALRTIYFGTMVTKKQQSSSHGVWTKWVWNSPKNPSPKKCHYLVCLELHGKKHSQNLFLLKLIQSSVDEESPWGLCLKQSEIIGFNLVSRTAMPVGVTEQPKLKRKWDLHGGFWRYLTFFWGLEGHLHV